MQGTSQKPGPLGWSWWKLSLEHQIAQKTEPQLPHFGRSVGKGWKIGDTHMCPKVNGLETTQSLRDEQQHSDTLGFGALTAPCLGFCTYYTCAHLETSILPFPWESHLQLSILQKATGLVILKSMVLNPVQEPLWIPNPLASCYLSMSLPRSPDTNRRGGSPRAASSPCTAYWLKCQHASAEVHPRAHIPCTRTPRASPRTLSPCPSGHPCWLYIKPWPQNRLSTHPQGDDPALHPLPGHSAVPRLSTLGQFCQNFVSGWFHKHKCVQGWESSLAYHNFHPPLVMGTGTLLTPGPLVPERHCSLHRGAKGRGLCPQVWGADVHNWLCLAFKLHRPGPVPLQQEQQQQPLQFPPQPGWCQTQTHTQKLFRLLTQVVPQQISLCAPHTLAGSGISVGWFEGRLQLLATTH